MARLLLAAATAVLIAAAACSSVSPTSPSGTGATITGTVISSPSAANVTVAGTPLSATIDGTGSFALRGVPAGNVQLVFSGSGASSAVSLLNVTDQELIELEVAITGDTATVQREVRGSSGKVVLCHNTGNGSYHTIDVSVNAEPAHRAHGDAKPGEPVPADETKVFGRDCSLISPVEIQKLTNGQDVSQAPGPVIPVGSLVTWTYVVTNRTTQTLTSLTVTDDRGVAVACPQALPAPGASITCTASGIAVAGQYRNVGTVVAAAGAKKYTDSDESFYHGGPIEEEDEEEEPKVQLCHRTGNGSYHMISVGAPAEPAHRAHGDGMVGEPVPGSPGQVFTSSCGLRPAGPTGSGG